MYQQTIQIQNNLQTWKTFKKEVLKEKIADGLNLSNSKTPKFYMKLKTHRKDNPGQPVVSSVDCHTSSISKCVDYTLQPIVKDIPSCV